jgi:excisionase family DNA binding protein
MTIQTAQIGHLAPIAYTPEDAARVSGRSRSRVYEAIKNQELLARKDGRSTVIERDELIRWIRSMPCVVAA